MTHCLQIPITQFPYAICFLSSTVAPCHLFYTCSRSSYFKMRDGNTPFMSLRKGWLTRNVWPVLTLVNILLNILLLLGMATWPCQVKECKIISYSHWRSYSKCQMDEPCMEIFLVVRLNRLIPVPCGHCFTI